MNRANTRKTYYKVQEIFEFFRRNIKSAVIPGESLTIDEQLYPFRGRCPFRQYLPKKPARYGLKYWSVCDSKTAYLIDTELYLGSESNSQINVESNQETNILNIIKEK